jgi:hypothetical protein
MLHGGMHILSCRIPTQLIGVGVSEKYGNHKTNKPFDGCLVSDWDLSVKKIRRRRANSFVLSVFTDCVTETTHFRPFDIAQVTRHVPFYMLTAELSERHRVL